MASNPRYDPVSDDEVERFKDEPENEIETDPQDIPLFKKAPTGISWWKILLGILLAIIAGLVATFAASLGPFSSKSDSTSAATTTAAAEAISSASATPSATSTASSDTATEVAYSDLKLSEQYDSAELKNIILECGFSPDDARRRGCVFDVMMQDWVPEPCYDSLLTERYLAEGNYTWWTDGNGNETMTDEVMRKGEHGSAWMASSYHQAHCIFSWEKTVRAMRNDRPISQELVSYDHVMHCRMQTLNGAVMDENIGVRAPTNYAKCALYETWRNNWIPDKHSTSGEEMRKRQEWTVGARS
jgi:hypothetical protein